MSPSSNKEAALDFLNLVVAGKIDEAYTKHVDLHGKHHNIYFPAGFPALREAMKDNHQQFPSKKFAVKNVVCEGDFVTVHSHVMLKANEPGFATFHQFRFKNGKIAEMWDCIQKIEANSPNQDGPF